MKMTALLCTLSWSAFWVFGGLALLTPNSETTTLLISTLLSATGLLAGVVFYLRLSRTGGV